VGLVAVAGALGDGSVMTCTRCHKRPGEPRRERAERVLCDSCAALRPVVDWKQPPDPQQPPAGLRTRAVDWQRVRPLRWLWKRRIPIGLPSLLVGEEGMGKGTLAAWLIARATRGELDGDLQGEPIRVLVIGDEDGFEPIWVPRLHAAGADLDMVRTLADGEYLDDLRARSDDLRKAVQRDEVGLVLLDQVLDHVPGGSAGEAVYNPKPGRFDRWQTAAEKAAAKFDARWPLLDQDQWDRAGRPAIYEAGLPERAVKRTARAAKALVA
jgi:hypothetical protein